MLKDAYTAARLADAELLVGISTLRRACITPLQVTCEASSAHI